MGQGTGTGASPMGAGWEPKHGVQHLFTSGKSRIRGQLSNLRVNILHVPGRRQHPSKDCQYYPPPAGDVPLPTPEVPVRRVRRRWQSLLWLRVPLGCTMCVMVGPFQPLQAEQLDKYPKKELVQHQDTGNCGGLYLCCDRRRGHGQCLLGTGPGISLPYPHFFPQRVL